jgi:myo-inositol-1(or 4)-monophosphatase
LVKEISDKYEKDGFLGEEEIDKVSKSEFSWVIDPIDGTTNFIYRIPFFTISVALVDDDDNILGGIWGQPLEGKIYSTYIGSESIKYNSYNNFRVEKIEDALIDIAIPHRDSLTEVNIHTYKELIKRANKLRIFGFVSYELLMLVTGSIDAVISIGMKWWDVAAGISMVKEAGGEVVNFDGEQWSRGDNTLIASNKSLNQDLLSVLNSIDLDLNKN